RRHPHREGPDGAGLPQRRPTPGRPDALAPDLAPAPAAVPARGGAAPRRARPAPPRPGAVGPAGAGPGDDGRRAGAGVRPDPRRRSGWAGDGAEEGHERPNGTLYRARWVARDGREAALRVYPVAFQFDEQGIRRFMRGIPRGGTIRHPNVVRLYRGGLLKGRA